MNPQLTAFLAIWGAVLGTFGVLWNIWVWARNSPRIVAKIEFFDFPEPGIIGFEVRNHGTRSTTVEEKMLVNFDEGFWGRLGYIWSSENVSVKHSKTAKLPIVLQPGEVWKGYAPIREESPGLGRMDKPALLRTGRLYYKIRCAHTNHLLSGKVRPESIGGRL